MLCDNKRSNQEIDVLSVQNSSIDAYVNDSVRNKYSGFLEIADFDNDGQMEFLTRMGIQDIPDLSGSTFRYYLTGKIIGTPSYKVYTQIGDNPLPTDLDGNSELEVLSISGVALGWREEPNLYWTNYSQTNHNPTINSVTYTPSLCIEPNSTLIIDISASDTESDTIYYSHKCSDTDNQTAFNTTSTRSCSYGEEGSYTNTISVNDTFHLIPNTYSDTVTVKQNCTQSSVRGSMPLPTELIRREAGLGAGSERRGLLPEIFYGTINFFKMLPALATLGFMLLVVMIIVAVALLIKSIFTMATRLMS
jgi:hypothetical protein